MFLKCSKKHQVKIIKNLCHAPRSFLDANRAKNWNRFWGLAPKPLSRTAFRTAEQPRKGSELGPSVTTGQAGCWAPSVRVRPGGSDQGQPWSCVCWAHLWAGGRSKRSRARDSERSSGSRRQKGGCGHSCKVAAARLRGERDDLELRVGSVPSQQDRQTSHP